MRIKLPWYRILWIIFVLAVPGFLIHNYFPKVFKCPACFLFGDTGDGLKNYYTLDYYVKHDTGWHFTGMNYPYGEHIIYTDNQPLLAMVMGWIDRHITDMDRHVVGTLNMLLLISIYLAVIFSYLLLRRWGIGRWWALGSALCITFLSPQLWRLQGHYGLAYVFFFPLFLLLLDHLVHGKGKKVIWSISLSLLTIVMSLSHMYFLFLSSVLLFAYTIFWWWYNRRDKFVIRNVIPWLMGVMLLPGLFLIMVRKWTDPIKDRPIEPYGIDAHTLDFGTTFFPFLPPLDKVWTIILEREKPLQECVSYVGLIGLLMLPGLAFFFLAKRKDEFISVHIKALLGAALILWGMGAGVIYHNGFKFLWESFPVLKQFRGLGRFGFPFYYVYLFGYTYLIWTFYKKLEERELGALGSYVLGAIFIVWGFEAQLNISAVSGPIFKPNTYLASSKNDYLPLLTAAGYKPEDFQAILQFPLVAIGNETMGVDRGSWTMREGIHASTETGLPMIDYTLSRTSIAHGLDIVELISTPYAPKRRAEGFNDKPILLLCEEEFVIPAERKWIDRAKKIGTYQSITLYTIPAAAFKTLNVPVLTDTDTNNQCNGWYNGFEEFLCDTTMTGKGALPILTVPASIWSYTDTTRSERQWIVSFWSHVDNLKGAVPVPRMMEKDPHGTVLRNTGLHREAISWSEAHGEWIEISFPWNTLGGGFSYELFVDNAGPVIDNLLIRSTSDTCVYFFSDMTLYNNLPIPVVQ